MNSVVTKNPTGKELGLIVCHLFKETFDLTKLAIINQVIDFVKDHPGISLWGSPPVLYGAVGSI